MVAGVHRPSACAVTQNEEPGRLNGICQVTRLPAPSVDPAFLAASSLYTIANYRAARLTQPHHVARQSPAPARREHQAGTTSELR